MMYFVHTFSINACLRRMAYCRGGEPAARGPHAARLSFQCGPRARTAHVMLGLPYVLLFNISAY